MAKNRNLAVIIILDVLLLIGLSTIVVLLIMGPPDEGPFESTGSAVAETNNAVGSKFALTPTSMGPIEATSPYTNTPNTVITSTLEIGNIPVPTTTFELTAISD